MSGHGEQSQVEPLLARVFAPIEPPAGLATRVETRLQSISQLAADELDGWELAAMRDPRNWLRPALALLCGGAAGAGLLLLGRRQSRRTRSDDESPGADH
jgi:hypothetical protein